MNLPRFKILVPTALSVALCFSAASSLADETPSGGMIRYPDVSAEHIAFVYAGDVWVVSRKGGMARPLASPAGGEMNPKFSPDGKTIAFVGNYDGGTDLYQVPAGGGIAQRVTFHPGSETLCDWTPDGELLFSSNAFAGLSRMTQLLTISEKQPFPELLPVPYGSNGAISPDGTWLAYTPYSRDTRTWKRYRGGMASDVWLFNLQTQRSQQITDWEGTDSIPMWHGQSVYYLSDAGPNHRLNIWRYDTNSQSREQITKHADYDVKWPSIGPGAEGDGEIVYQQGSSLRLLDLSTGESEKVNVTIPGDRPRLRPQRVDASKFITGGSISPAAKRVAVAARGDIWSLAAENGRPRNLTDTDSVNERDPAWSPDGRWIAFFSDATGEYELTLMQSDGRGELRRLTNDGSCWRSNPVWSPDSKMIAFSDKTGAYHLHDIDSSETKNFYSDPTLAGAQFSWSHDSAWLAYCQSSPTGLGNQSIWLYNVQEGKSHQLTSGYFNDSSPAFDRKGEFLYYQSNRRFANPQYEDVGTTFIYRDTGVLLGIPLRSDVENPLLKSIDVQEWDEESEKAADDSGEESENEDGEEGDDSDESEESETTPERDPLSGSWSLTVESELIPESDRNVTLVLKRDADGSVSGYLETPGGQIPLGDPTFDKASGQFSATVESPLGEAVIEGVVSGDSMEGVAKISAVGAELPFTAQRDSADEDSGEEEPGEKDAAEKSDDKDADKKEEAKPLEIEFDGAERRAIPLPISPGRFRGLVVGSKGQLVFSRFGDESGIYVFDLSGKSPSAKQIVAGGGGYELTADGKKMLLFRGSSMSITEPSAGKGSGKSVSTSGMMTSIEPRAEWKQVFTEAWRHQRDFFYDPTMHGVDWDAVRVRYEKLLDDATSRNDVGFIIAEMISELNVGHAYYRGLPLDSGTPSSQTAVLAGMLKAEGDRFIISDLWEGAAWDTDAQNPLRVAGVKAGQYLLEVEGQELTTDQNPYALLDGLAGKLCELVVSDDAQLDDDDARIAVVLPRSDSGLRFRDWIEHNRAYVDEKTDGKVGYIFVTNTGQPGQNDLFRQFYAQSGKAALIIDERWNGGGQIPTRFIELLNRPVTNYWAKRDGVDWTWPPDSHQGPKCMLINGLSGSGGDMFPALFRQNKIGKLIGRRTWGGLVGIEGNRPLMDGASVTVPSFAYYETDGTWGIEGHGVDPDIEVIDDPARMTDGGDPQLDAAIEHILSEIDRAGYHPPKRPAYPQRSKMGLPKEDY
ncbi:MAG TPA: hypothetical protein DDW52_04270 [Planctomycetaceae bacterium]|nr:hypothetical protein [Planctomycetaceae bacterium]